MTLQRSGSERSYYNGMTCQTKITGWQLRAHLVYRNLCVQAALRSWVYIFPLKVNDT